MQIGEGFAGSGAEAAHVNTVLGAKEGPVGTAWVTALATPRIGHAPFVVVARPNLPVKPFTLFVNKAAVDTDKAVRHAHLTWGAAQAGVAAGVIAAAQRRVLRADELESLLLIAAVWVDPDANDEALVYDNNQAATLAALSAGHDGLPRAADVAAAGAPHNPFFRP
jgi:5,6,7,8-tetrahydromethanopterin hydro-lyase